MEKYETFIKRWETLKAGALKTCTKEYAKLNGLNYGHWTTDARLLVEFKSRYGK